ncbi:uncharacterized protein LOC128999159 [Macrosteles quadrilineatus]|uniref:uncharacterized protein LOC128999159 n=1 Tax=Macrosteles quadrilineatus TaxID=74068 RepID=UPI0023E2D2D1|nr:uncharacterized protein LOC128999159 [Macrosteles quadrilineatus]
MVSRSSPVTASAVVATVVVVLVCLASSASGSCLSYGHSCWGAHGKRSGAANTQWFISRLAPRQLESQWIPKVAQESPEDLSSRRSSGEASLILPADSDLPDDMLGSDDKQVIIMEQPPRLYKILNHLPSKLERK